MFKLVKITSLFLSGLFLLPGVQAQSLASLAPDVLENNAVPPGNYATDSSELVVAHVLGQLIISSGSTPIENTNWQAFNNYAIYVDVDTSAAGFTETPNYVTSVGGYGNHWIAQGASAIYNATPTGFRVYLRFPSPISPPLANTWGWHVLWTAIGPKQ